MWRVFKLLVTLSETGNFPQNFIECKISDSLAATAFFQKKKKTFISVNV
jgi:hypothetical protein